MTAQTKIMELSRAREIVSAVNGRAFMSMGLAETVGSLAGVSLSEMIEAKAVVLAENRRAEEEQRANGGSMSISTTSDDRLIAAVYVLEHYRPTNEAILCLPRKSFWGDRIALGVFALQGDEDAEEGDD